MDAIINFIRESEFLEEMLKALLKLVLAMVFGGTIGLERGKQGRAAGMRTHIFVCLGATLVTMIGFYAKDALASAGDPLRIAAQVVSGIGFLGVGTILLKGRFQITGLTTAAELWCVAAIGIALGAGFYTGATITFICAMLTATIVHKIEYTLNKRNRRFGIYVEINSAEKVRETINHLGTLYKISDVQVTASRSGQSANIGIEANIHNSDLSTNPDEVAKKLEEIEWVVFALESI